MLSEQARDLAGVTRVFGDLDMVFADELSEKEHTSVEKLVLKRYNEAVAAAAARESKPPPKPATRNDFDFDGGWDSDSRFETVECDIAEELCSEGTVEPLFGFLAVMDSIAPLEQVVVCVEAPIRWFENWYEELEGDLGHYLEPAHVKFKRNPTEIERRRIERIFGFKEARDDEYETDGIWYDSDTFAICIFEPPADASELFQQLKRASRVVPVDVAGIGVVVNL